MFQRRITALAFLLFGSFATLFAMQLTPSDWKDVNDAVAKGRPETAVKALEPIIQKAIDTNDLDAAARGIAMRVMLKGNIQGNLPAEIVQLYESEIANAPEPIKPVLEALLAHSYWGYFQQNRWQFAQRTEGAVDANDKDFTTWDLARILDKIDSQFQTALADDERLQAVASSDFSEFLDKGNTGDDYRPTLFDVITESAIEFYSAGEQAGSVSSDAFVLDAASPIFEPLEKFVDWQPDSQDPDSALIRAITLYQKVLTFHQGDEDETALLDFDLARLRFGYNHATEPNKSQRYEEALKTFAETNRDNEVSSLALHELADQYHNADQRALAHKTASEGLARHPESVGANRCFNLIQAIEAKTCSGEVERVWNDPFPEVELVYTNITKAYFRLVPLDYDAFLTSGNYGQPLPREDAELARVLQAKPIRQWSVDLPVTADYMPRRESVTVPHDVPLGSYYLITSHDESFRTNDNQISVTEVWRSDLSLIVQTHQGQGRVSGFVLDAKSGEPVANANVDVWKFPNNRGRRSDVPRVEKRLTTDQEGRFEVSQKSTGVMTFVARVGKDRLASPTRFASNVHSNVDRARSNTLFFTDRAIYRPGQSVHYKGICYSTDQAKDAYRTLASQNVTVVFKDSNGQEIERRSHRSNDYGSFSGTFTAPRDRLMGEMSLLVEVGPSGSVGFRVEEYKRPKFRVEVQTPTKTAKLGDDVTVQGVATAYTGVPIDGAMVKYRVTRQAQYAPWWYWRCWWQPVTPQPVQEIAVGTTTTDELGRFDVDFVARPDESVDKASEPTFRYIVYADVTDTTGETRSDDATISLGYSAISATLSADDWLTQQSPTQITVLVNGLLGDDANATGTLKVHRLIEPESIGRPSLSGVRRHRFLGGVNQPVDKDEVDPSNPNSWPLGEVVAEFNVATAADGKASFSTDLMAGIYRAVLTVADDDGNDASAVLPLQVFDPESDTLKLKLPFILESKTWSYQPGETVDALWGSGYEKARVYVEIEHRGKILKSYWTAPNVTQGRIKVPVTEAMRGGFTIRTTMVKENRAYLQQKQVAVPWTNKELDITWQRFVSKLKPAAEETWTASIRTKGDQDNAAIAEMVATLYDASLEAFVAHRFGSLSNLFRSDYSLTQSSFANANNSLTIVRHGWTTDSRDAQLTYWRLPAEYTNRFWGGIYGRGLNLPRGVMMKGNAMPMPMAAPAAMMYGEGMEHADFAFESEALGVDGLQDARNGEAAPKTPSVDLENVSARTNLNETAFFLPHLVSDKEGIITMSFTMPEALTEWKFIGLAHDKKLRSGSLSGTTVTAKDLMVQPNPPRFVREGDEIELTVKVSNQSPTIQTGSVRLTFADARTRENVDAKLANQNIDQEFEIPAGQSRSLSWRIKVEDDLGVLTYKAVGSTGKLSDGEEGYLPVLSRRVLVTESLPLPIRGKETKEFDFDKLITSGKSDSIEHQSLTVQMVSNPSWYAVMALPYLMEYPHDCSEQTFNRLYANSLASHIVGSDPKIAQVFDQWRNTPALDSPLEKNEDIRTVMIEESPWLRDAKQESQSRRDVALLFTNNRLKDEMARAMQKLSQMQMDDGSWPWFDGGRSNHFLTLYITTGMGRLRHLGVEIDVSMATKSLGFLDGWINRIYTEIDEDDRDKNHLSSTIALYLYGRSFFLKDQPIAQENQAALNYFVNQASKHWLSLRCRQSEAHIAVALKRLGKLDPAKDIMVSLKERSVSDDELGMFWRDTENSWWWYRAPIESQAMMIEAFDEVMNDQDAVEDCKVWLLKQKQTQNWPTTKSTADSIYALLLRGTDLLASDELVQVSLAGKTVEPTNVEAGTGFYQERFVKSEIKPEMGNVTLTKVDDGVAWGSLHWQYLEDLSKVTPHDGTPLTLTKQLFVKENTKDGPKLMPVDGAVNVGDELVVRVVLRSDRDMEYVHLKDHRGSGTEPVNVLSRYKSQDGLFYYESTRDTASHFFIDYLPKGTYVFEYSTRVQLVGKYQTGFANIECMYAPEFNAHSESLPIVAQ
ncbi:MG2 domain protein [Rubripirellula amarantea]|uniref:MG2 domain protein n=2 Tax=Rubripirellula amarantea TaxID=2527999 RepID=A0A5C5WTB2_9BACT|nr:MG2 domain protein [Rubripirellula amarantea]